jgi:hypothetical protein
MIVTVKHNLKTKTNFLSFVDVSFLMDMIAITKDRRSGGVSTQMDQKGLIFWLKKT